MTEKTENSKIPQIQYANISLNSTTEIKGLFSISGPSQNIIYANKRVIYFGKFINNSFEGDAIYYDHDQFFTYIGSFHENMKDGFGILLQYNKQNYEYRSADYVSSASDFASYSTSQQQYMGTQILQARTKFDNWRKIIENIEGAIQSQSKPIEIYEMIRKICNYSEIKKIQPSKTTFCYIGELKEDIREGLGISYLKNGDIYIGKYSKNKRNGFGLYIWSDENSKYGSIAYAGYINNNVFTKYGAVILKNEDFYIGQISNGTFNGKGSYFMNKSELLIYEGEFRQSKKSGPGKYFDPESNINYEGCFENELASGNAVQKFDSFVFSGNFKAGLKIGKCELKLVENPDICVEKIEGEIKDGILNGPGKFLDQNGNEFIGEFKNNKLNGKCRILYKNGSECECVFVDGKRKGEAKVTLPPEKGWKKGESKTLIYEFDVATNV